MERRRFLEFSAAGFALTPIAAMLAACGRSNLPDGLAETKWDRDTCTRCGMVLSDRRFAAQAKGGPQERNFKFDDIGCAVFWLKDQSWGREAATRIWVTDLSSRGDDVKWLDAKKAQYLGGKTSPMGYNFGAVAMAQPGSLDFETMREHVLAKGR
jgi:copper chaperone NosL